MTRPLRMAILGLWLSTGAALASQNLVTLPDLPKLTFTDFVPEVRSQVKQAYDAASAHSQDAEASGKLGMLLDLYQRPEQAASCYRRAHQLDPGSFRWLYYLGSLQALQGKHGDAVVTLRAALALRPDYLPARLKLGESLFTAGEFDQSEGVYSAIVKQFSDVAEAYYGLGRISAVTGKLEAAATFFRKALELFPNYGAAHYALAQADRKLANNEESQKQLALYAKNRSIVPPVEDPLRDELRRLDQGAVSHLERGVQLEQVGRIEDAITETEKALQLDPKLVQAHVNLIILYGRMGDREKAEAHYQAAISLNPDQFPDAYYNYGVLLLGDGNLDGAEKAFRHALEINPSYADAHNNLGNLLERQGKLEEAMAEYRKAVEEQPDFRQAHFNLGRILVNQAKYQEGIQNLREALLPVDGNTPAYMYALGAAYGRAGDRENALHYLQEAREQASARGQTELVRDIDRDLHTLESQSLRP